jgi:hypothetical protein
MSVRERRAQLRDMGLKDSSMKLFTEQVGVPPPAKDAAVPRPTAKAGTNDEMPLILRGIFANPPATDKTAADQPTRPAPGAATNRNGVRDEDEPVKPGAWKRVFARFAPPGGAASEQTANSGESTGVTQASTNPPVPPTFPAAKSDPPGFLGRMFSSRPTPPATPSEQMPRTVESMGVTPISTTPTLRTP